MLEGKIDNLEGQHQSDPISGLIDMEVSYLERSHGEDPNHTLLHRSKDLTDAFVEQHGNEIRDLEQERFKVEWLAEWAVRDIGVQDPVEFLNLIAKMEGPARMSFPHHKFLDALYRTAREQRLYKDMGEVNRVGY